MAADADDQHSSIRFAKATRIARALGMPQGIELLQLVEGSAGGDWEKFTQLLREHGVDQNVEGDRQALRIALIIRRMELEEAQWEETKKRYPDIDSKKNSLDDAK